MIMMQNTIQISGYCSLMKIKRHNDKRLAKNYSDISILFLAKDKRGRANGLDKEISTVKNCNQEIIVEDITCFISYYVTTGNF